MPIKNDGTAKYGLGSLGRSRLEHELLMNKQAKNKTRKIGARTVFIEAFKSSRDMEEAKKVLLENGFNLDMLNDQILRGWLEDFIKQEEREKEQDKKREEWKREEDDGR